MSRRLTAAAVLPAIGLSFALASTAAASQVTETQSTERPVADTTADRFGFFEGEQLQVSTGTDEDNLTFRIALPTGASMASRFSLRVSTPLHGDDQAMPASLDGLANGSRATLSWGYFPLRVQRGTVETDRIDRAAEAACRAQEPTSAQCSVSTYAVYHYDRANWLRYLRLRGRGVTDYGIDATVGINDFEWIAPLTLMHQKARRTDWSVAGHVTHYFAGRQTALTGSASYQRAYEAADEQLLCPPNPLDPATQCVTGRGAGPNRNENLLFSVGLRYRLVNADGSLGRLAVAPVVTYEAIDDVWGVDVPVYFIPGENDTLNGGVRFGYRSDREDAFSISVFVGTAFNFFGG